MNETDRQLRDLLEAAVGEPPHQVSAEAVRRRVTWRRAVECITAALAVVVVAVLGPAGIRALGHTLRPAGQQGSATVYVGGHSAAIAVTPDGKTAYVISAPPSGPGTIIPLATATNTPGTPIRTSQGPDAIAFTPDGKTAYVTDGTSGTVIPISPATNAPGPPIHVGGHPAAIAVTPGGQTAYVADGTSGTVIPISTATNTPGKPIRIGGPLGGISVTP